MTERKFEVNFPQSLELPFIMEQTSGAGRDILQFDAKKMTNTIPSPAITITCYSHGGDEQTTVSHLSWFQVFRCCSSGRTCVGVGKCDDFIAIDTSVWLVVVCGNFKRTSSVWCNVSKADIFLYVQHFFGQTWPNILFWRISPSDRQRPPALLFYLTVFARASKRKKWWSWEGLARSRKVSNYFFEKLVSDCHGRALGKNFGNLAKIWQFLVFLNKRHQLLRFALTL